MKSLLSRLGWNAEHPVSHREKIISGLGGFIGILAVFWTCRQILDLPSTIIVLASIGSSAVLMFAVPHGALSQPWPVIGGHLISAAIGVAMAHWLDNVALAAPLSVGLSILAMHYLRCLHPPGGATALAAVLGGPEIHNLGFDFLLEPVLVNVVIIVIIAMLFNSLFPWRRPAALSGPQKTPELVCPPGEKCMIAHSDLVYALSEVESYIDVSEDDLLQIYALAMQHAILSDEPEFADSRPPAPGAAAAS